MEDPTTNTSLPEKEIPGPTGILDLLSQKIVGQETAISGIASTVKTYQAGLSPAGRPAGVFLLLGPTGTGKTRTVEALAEILHNAVGKIVKVDCGEFQSDHEVAKLIGAPPGYLGHRETRPVLTQDKLTEATSEHTDLSIVLFDEIEKAAPALTKLLLGVLDKATLRLGDNAEVNFEKSLIFLTSNLGAREMMKELQPELGFRPAPTLEASDLTKRLEAIALNAVRKMYSPEFVNRIDAVITYQPLDSEAFALILDQELADLQNHVNSRLGNRCFSIEISEESRGFLLEKGTSSEYGARELKRSIHRFLIQPLATLVIENTIQPGSTVRVLLNEAKDGLMLESVRGIKPAVVSPPTVLIVDDNRDFLRLLALDLGQAAHWGVSTAQSVVEAEHACSMVPIDFALLDLILPDGNGIELGANLKKRWPAIHVAIMTGGDLSATEAYECQRFGFDIVNKPFLAQQIISLVRERGIKMTSRVSA